MLRSGAVAGSGLAFRRGFWRLTLLVWIAGAAALLWWEDEPLFAPIANACIDADTPVYPECAAPPDPARRGLAERLLDAVRTPPPVVDTSRSVPRWTTARYRAAVRSVALWQATWTALVWGPFYLLVWAFAGFRMDAPPARLRSE